MALAPNPNAINSDIARFTAGPFFANWEKFRVDGPRALESLQSGGVATLVTKAGPFKVMRDEDFQVLLGHAREAERFRRGGRLLLIAVKHVRRNRDEDSLALLEEAVLAFGESPSLPTRVGHAPFELDVAPLADGDEVILDPAELEAAR